MPRNLTRRNVLTMTTGAALAAPATLAAALPATSDAASTPPTPDRPMGPRRRIEGTMVAGDRSETPSPLHREAGMRFTIDIVPDGRGVLTLSHIVAGADRSILLPADVAREIDRVLFFDEWEYERRKREKREAGMVACPFDHFRGPCPAGVCDEDRMVHPTAVTRHLGPWITAEETARHLHRIPSAWGAVVASYPYWVGKEAERLAGTSEDGRVEDVEIQLHGPGWGAGPIPEGDHPDGPTINLWTRDGSHHHPSTDRAVEWSAYLPGDPVHGGADTVAEAIDLAVASLEGRLAPRTLAA